MRQISEGFNLSFKEKIELSKLLDKLGVDIIELEGIANARIDSLRIKSIATAVSESTVAVPVELNNEGIETAWAAVKLAKHPRLQVIASTSAVQIEYLFHKKPEAMIETIKSSVAKCASLCGDVEFIAADATRSDQSFLTLAIKTAIESGANTITLCDTAGTMLPAEFSEFVKLQYQMVPELSSVTLGVSTTNEISMADASAISAIFAGAAQISASAYPINSASIANIARIISSKSDALDSYSNIRTTQLGRITEQISWVCQPNKKNASVDEAKDEDSDIFLTSHDDQDAVTSSVKSLGYDLSEDDLTKVYNAFIQIAKRKEKVGLKELDAIVASSAMQVPPTYKLDTYVITSGNTISATAHIKLLKNGQPIEGVYIGDGSIDAAFQTIENITGCHYELYDFQLQAVTEGREAMGQTIVKLSSGSKVYSGRGISTDIVGAGIQAYLRALNKIIYEEEVE